MRTRGTLKLAMCSRAHATSSPGSGGVAGAGTTKAMPTSPMRSSGTPITATWAISGWLEQQALDLGRVGVEAAGDEHVLLAVGDPDVAALVHRADVAGVQPSVGVDRLGRLLRVLEVPAHHVVAAHHDLAGLAARHLAAVVVDDRTSTPGMARPRWW